MSSLPPRKNPTPTKISKQHLSPLQVLLQLGFPKHRAEKALAATGNETAHLASDWLLAHVNDPLLDDNSPREYILYACPTGSLLHQLQGFWKKSLQLCGWNGAHNYTPHITLVSFFKAPDEDAPNLAHSLKSIMDRQGAKLNEPLKLETYISPNFMGFFVAEEHADYLKRIAMQYVKEVSNATISLEPHVKSLHLTLAYQFPNSQYTNLKTLVEELDPNVSCNWELRLYSRDSRVNGKQVHKVIQAHSPIEHDELDLINGDYVYIGSEAVSNSADGWVEGTSWLTGNSGLLPEKYTERTAESDAWTLHKKVDLTLTTEIKPSPAKTKTYPEHSVLNNDEICIPKFNPDDIKDIEMDEKLMAAKEVIYQNLLDMKSKGYGDTDVPETPSKSRNIYIMRHGERIDFAFGSWVPYCFDDTGKYIRKDLNMPINLPIRSSGPKGYLRDTPLTNVGVFEATLVGRNLKENNVVIDHVYCSPSFRCIQTCDAVLQGMNSKDSLKIKIEPGLFEWLVWYPHGLPEWMTKEELKTGGYNIDENYVPFIKEKDLKESPEGCEQFYLRSAFVTRGALAAHVTGNILLVGHAATLDVCSRELVGKPPRNVHEMTKLIQKVPYCSLVCCKSVEDKWEISEPPCMPITHTTNQRFDWKILTN
ncbi:protein UBASH3A homolog isoform X2 [Aethina tumida]|uniref:protein UBASH3A homolog isoform X2 n=1 Tax=Aethina tumida TaxID=116153 RepID=UPI00096B62F5|nr:protein UBASH3A homolog isoform X2 [Aethina tumida]